MIFISLSLSYSLNAQTSWYLETPYDRFDAGENSHSYLSSIVLEIDEDRFTLTESFYVESEILASGSVQEEGSPEPFVGWTEQSHWHRVTTEENLFYKRYITNGTLVFWDYESKVEEGALRSFNGIAVQRLRYHYLDLYEIKLRYNAKVRAGPGIDYDSMMLQGNRILNLFKRQLKLYCGKI